MDTLRVALCDDHPLLRSGLRRLLEAEADVEVVGEAGTLEDAVAVAVAKTPDVFIVDIGLPGGNGIEATRRIRLSSPETRVLILTMHEDVEYLRAAFAAGAVGYLLKEAAEVELLIAVRAIAAGKRYVHPTLGGVLIDVMPEPPELPAGLSILSGRENDVLRLLALGYTNPEVAEQLHISVRTVETHRAHIQQKLGLRSRAELARFAQQEALPADPG